MKNIGNFIHYITEELTDIPAEGKNLHFTNIEALLQILKSGKLKGANYYTKADKFSKKPGRLEIATLRNNYMTPEHGFDPELSNNIDNVKITLYTDRIKAGVRGIKKNPIAEFPLEYQKALRNQKREFESNFNKTIPNVPHNKDSFCNRFSSIFTIDPTKIKNEDTKYLIKWCKDHGYTEKETIAIGYYYKALAQYKEALLHREKEERFDVDEKGIPADPKYMKIELFHDTDAAYIDAFADVSTDSETKEGQIEYLKNAIILLTKSDPNLLIRNKYYDKLVKTLKEIYKDIIKK